MPSPRPRRPRPTPALALAAGALAAATLLAAPVPGQAGQDPPPPLRPWLWTEAGTSAWGAHQFWEDDAATARVLARDLVRPVGQPAHVPDLLLLNSAQFEPPEGEPAAPGSRRLARDSLAFRSLQLFVNYSGVPITAAGPDLYPSPTWFVSLPPGHTENLQTEPPVPDLGFGDQRVSATRGAWGLLQAATTPHGQLAQDDDGPLPPQALYVTASIGYALADLHPDDQALALEARRDRLMVRDPTSGRWNDEPWRLPPGAADGNASGVAFADLNGDGWMDLYVGRCGDDFAGAPDGLLLQDGAGLFVDASAAGLAGHPALATQEVLAHDLDDDGDLDLVLAARCRRGGPCGAESQDAVLVNDGTAQFAWQALALGSLTDSRSVALGDLDQDGRVELVLGNAGADGPVDSPVLPPSQRHPLQILGDVDPGPGLQYVQRLTDFLNPQQEQDASSGHTWQVLVHDLIGTPGSAAPWVPDGRPDLLLVEHRAILQGANGRPGSEAVLLANTSPGPGLGALTLACRTPAAFLSAVALSNQVRDGLGLRDLFLASSHPYGGSHADFQRHIGPLLGAGAPTPWDPNPALVNLHRRYDALPGNEHGYGFDVADLDDDGLPEVLQTARAYNYLIHGLGGAATHRPLTGPSSPVQLANVRGRLSPRALEDAVFVDVDGDGRLDVVGACTVAPSPAQSDQQLGASVDLLVLDGAGGPEDLVHDTRWVPDAYGGPPQLVDARVDPGGRTAWPRPASSDRVVAGDLDNDGDPDVLAHLFEIRFDAGQPIPPVLPEHGFDLPLEAYAFGWRWLRNVAGEPGAGPLWFRDEAPLRMLDHRSLAYSPAWNRSVGADVLLDVDNNGALDLYTTKGFPADVADPFSDTVLPEQNDDLLFLNGVQGLPPGVMVELGSLLLPPPCVPLDWDGDLAPDQTSCGSFGVAAGDVDGDGWTDVVVTHASYFGTIPGDPWLLINHMGTGGGLLDEFAGRVPMAQADPILHSPTHPAEPRPIDHADVPALGDLDGDGDLDLVLSVKDNRPRIWRNRGRDTNGDGWITPADGPELGHFEDVTAAVLGPAVRPTVDSQDLAFHDLDGDGDLDLVSTPFDDRPVLWRNGSPASERPAVTALWPRVGALAGSVVELRGARLDGLDRAELLTADGQLLEVTELWPGTDRRARLRLPCQAAPGLARLRVRRTDTPPGASEPVSLWSTLHCATVVLDAGPRPCAPDGPDVAVERGGPAPSGPLGVPQQP